MKALLLAVLLVVIVASSLSASQPAPLIEPLPDTVFQELPSVVAPSAAPITTIVDTRPKPDPTRTAADVPDSPVIVVTVPSASFKPLRSISGKASWFCLAGRSPCTAGHPDTGGFDAYAAAGPRLRAAICGIQSCASWRDRIVSVSGIRLKLVDWCQCGWHESWEKVIDLYYDVFVRTGGNVVISW